MIFVLSIGQQWKPPLKYYIILGKDFVQMIAKVSSGFMASGIQAILHSEI
jgi:hypothetical protein